MRHNPEYMCTLHAPVAAGDDLGAHREAHGLTGQDHDVTAQIQGAPLVDGIDIAAVQCFATLDACERSMGLQGCTYGQQRSATVAALEDDLVALETRGKIAARARVTASGSTAQLVVTAALTTPERSRILLVRPCYSGTERLFRSGIPPVDVVTVDMDPAAPDRLVPAVRALLDEHTAMIWVEAIMNPSLQVPDIAGLCRVAWSAGVPCVVDATLATPFVIRPLLDGATAVVHSLTKALNGHSDVFGGVAVVAARSAHLERFTEMAELVGGGMSPASAWLLRRSLSTASLRLERAGQNARDLAGRLRGCPGVQVSYPAIGGSLVTLALGGGRASAAAFIDALSNIPVVPSFGHVGTTVSYPHLGHPDLCSRPGCTPGLVRISLGIEHIDAITAEVDTALDAAYRHPSWRAVPRSAAS